MKLTAQLIYVQSKKIKVFDTVGELYAEKLKPFCEYEKILIKSEETERKNKDIKKDKESERILQKIKSDDYIILCDEGGKRFSSEEFSKLFINELETHKKVIFVIGGAFGVSEELKNRAQLSISLSSFVFNHHIAKLVLEEQIYRAFTISKNIPYHNE